MRMRRLFIIALPLALLTSGTAQSASPVSLFTNVVPTTAADTSNAATTLGLKFYSTQAGTISAIRFYRGATSPKGYVASLYSANGKAKLGSVTMAKESAPVPGWQQAVFATPISISANTTYVATYYAPSGQYADTPSGLAQTVTNAPLNAPSSTLVGGNGIFLRGNGFPTKADDTNFFVDVAFLPSGTPYLSIALTPANPTILSTAALGSIVAKITVTWSDGSAFTGKIAFGLPNSDDGGVYAIDSSNNLIINPSGPGVGASGGSVQNVTIVATQ